MAWWARNEPGNYQIGWREPGTHAKRFKTFKKKAAATSFKSDIESKLDRGEYTPQSQRRVPLGEYMEIVLGAGDLAASTKGAYGYRRNHTRDLEKKQLGEITTADIRKLMAAMEAAGLGAPIRTSTLKFLSKVFNTAVKDGILVRNPVAPVARPKSERREIQIYTPQEVRELSLAIGQGLGPAVLLSAYGGLRGGEVAGLRVSDVDWLRNTVSVVQAVQLVRGRAVLGEPKTKKSRRTVTVPRFVTEALATVAGVPDPSGTEVPAPATLLFQRPRGLHSSKTLGDAFRRALTATGMEGRWHDLRHTSVAFAIEAGAHAKTIQDRLGHESITTTLDTYGHLLPGTDEELAERLEASYRDAGEGGKVIEL